MPRGRRKLDTLDEIERVCYLHYQTSSTMAQIARHFEVSEGVVRRVIKEHGRGYYAARKDEIEAFRKHVNGW